MPRGVHDVDPVLVPEGRGGGAGDGDPALLLLLHPVHGGLVGDQTAIVLLRIKSRVADESSEWILPAPA